MRCPACHAANVPEAGRCSQCGEKLPDDVLEAEPADEEQRPRRRPASLSERDDDDYHYQGDGGISTLIPYKNPKALASYYCGIFALIPILGFFVAPAALILGIMGLRHRRANPEAKGTVHAMIGVVLGALGLVCNPLLGVGLYYIYQIR